MGVAAMAGQGVCERATIQEFSICLDLKPMQEVGRAGGSDGRLGCV